MQDREIHRVAPSTEVLILDDDRDALEEIQEILELDHISAQTSTTFADAFARLDASPGIKVVVTDVHIVDPASGVTNGVDFIQSARDRHPDRDLSFIVLSGDAGAVTASIETGAVDFLTKPLQPDALLAAIRAADSPGGSQEQAPDQDLAEILMRKVEETTRSLQKVTADLAFRERELSQSKAAFDRRRLQGAKLRQALAQGQIVPWFQPQVCARTGELRGFEALVRWIDPVAGTQNPAEFLPLAEEIGMMAELDAAVQQQAFEALRLFRADGHTECHIGINLTAAQLADPELVDDLMREIEQATLSPDRVAIEILESAMLDEAAADPIKDNVNLMGRIGFGIELDDFGTGHAGLSSLRDLAVTRIKIDRSYVRDVHADSKLQKFTRALISLAKALGIEVLAEGVETAEELGWLRAEGCDVVQGYFVAKPMPVAAALAWARENAAPAGQDTLPICKPASGQR